MINHQLYKFGTIYQNNFGINRHDVISGFFGKSAGSDKHSFFSSLTVQSANKSLKLRTPDNRLTPYNWLFIQTASGTYQGRPFELNIPRRCLHCQNPPCANLCPWSAASKDNRGIVRINDEICLGGSKCKDVCPWHIPERQTGVGLYLKLAPSFAGNGGSCTSAIAAMTA